MNNYVNRGINGVNNSRSAASPLLYPLTGDDSRRMGPPRSVGGGLGHLAQPESVTPRRRMINP